MAASSSSRCEKHLEKSLKNKTAITLLDNLENLGCKIPPGFFRCRSCPDNIAGGFSLENESQTSSNILTSSQENSVTAATSSSLNSNSKNNRTTTSSSLTTKNSSTLTPCVTACDNHNLNIETFQHTIIHELVHAYDFCRVKNFDISNVSYHACTEVRASSLSGECNYLHEILRRHTKFQGGHKECVRRRATKSVAMNPYAKDNAEVIVNKVFDTCYKDTSPFP